MGQIGCLASWEKPYRPSTATFRGFAAAIIAFAGLVSVSPTDAKASVVSIYANHHITEGDVHYDFQFLGMQTGALNNPSPGVFVQDLVGGTFGFCYDFEALINGPVCVEDLQVDTGIMFFIKGINVDQFGLDVELVDNANEIEGWGIYTTSPAGTFGQDDDFGSVISDLSELNDIDMQNALKAYGETYPLDGVGTLNGGVINTTPVSAPPAAFLLLGGLGVLAFKRRNSVTDDCRALNSNCADS